MTKETGSSTKAESISRIAGVIHAYPKHEPIHQAGIAARAEVSQATVSRALQSFIGKTLLIEGDLVRISLHGNKTRQYHPTSEFFEAVEVNAEWRRAAQIQELRLATGMEEDEVLDYALTLARDAVLGSTQAASGSEGTELSP